MQNIAIGNDFCCSFSSAIENKTSSLLSATLDKLKITSKRYKNCKIVAVRYMSPSSSLRDRQPMLICILLCLYRHYMHGV